MPQHLHPRSEHKNTLAGDEAHLPESVRERAIAAQAAKDGAIVTAILPSTAKSLKPWQASWPTRHPKAPHRIRAISESRAKTVNELRPKDKAKILMRLFHGVPAIAVDAVDAVAVYRVAYEAIVRARQGRGATLLECAAADGIHAASQTAVENQRINPISSDPVSSMEIYLKSKGIEPEQHSRKWLHPFNRDLELATRFLDQ